MKKIFKLIPAALALVAFASCSSDDLFDQNVASNAVDGKTMTAEIEGYESSTRTAFAENKTDGKLDKRVLVWTAGDSYKVYGELSTPDKYTLQNSSAGKSQGVFDLMTEDYNENPAFAVFPYDKVDADRANKKLTVKLSDWTYGTAEVKDEGYSEGAFVSNVPMYGKIADGAPKEAKFGYMTGILRVELQKLPKKTTRLIIVTDRPLTGTFTTDFDIDGDYPEIVSPVGDATAKEDVASLGLNITPNYTEKEFVMTVATEPVSQRTNKTFFIAVPTGNKYKVFDIFAEYNMAGSTETELVAQLGVTARKAAGKSVLNWQRGKVKSLTKEITVTASGNTPKALSDFLKDEWKTFPEGAEINITVPTISGNSYIELKGNATDDTFTVPAELDGKVVNIILQDGVAEGFGGTGTIMYIKDDDPAPVASTAKRLINFCVPTAANIEVEIDATETQVEFSAPDKTTATYKNFTSVKVAEGDILTEAAGLIIGKNVTQSGYIKLDDGSFLSEGTIYNIANNGDYEILVKGNANVINNNANGAVIVRGQLDDNGAIVNTLGKVTSKGTGDIYIENVDDVEILDGGANQKGAITIENVNGITGISLTTNEKHEAAISIKKVGAKGMKLAYKGLGAVTVDDAVGVTGDSYIAVNNKDNTEAFKATLLKGAFKEVKYTGKGNVTVSGAGVGTPVTYPTVITDMITGTTATPLTDGDVTITDATIQTSLTKNTKGALTITGVRYDFGTITNADGAISITGDNTSGADIASLTQNGTGIITLKDLSNAVLPTGAPNTPGVVTSLTANKATTINYENTFISALNGAGSGAAYNLTVNGTKSSGIGTVTAGVAVPTFTTDTWDGTSWCKVASANIYTSGSFAGLLYHTSSAAIDLLVSNSTIDLGSNAFQFKVGTTTYQGINSSITNLNGGKYKDASGNNISFTVKNLKAATGLFASSASTARSAALAVEYVTLDAPTITATANAGALIGTANGNNFKFTAVNVKNATIASTSTGKGTDINLGGFIGEVKAPSKTVQLWGCNVATASISGHYYMGGFIGQVTDANKVEIKDVTGGKDDKKGSTVSGITFNPKSNDGVWSTLKCGTIAPFIGGIDHIDDQSVSPKGELNIYGKFDSFNREANMWKMNFLNNESFKFIGTKQDDCNFIGYINVAKLPAAPTKPFQFFLKNLNGFEADVAAGGMTILSGGGAGKAYDEILATECNAYAEY